MNQFMVTSIFAELKKSPKSLIDWMRASQAQEEVFNQENERSLISVSLIDTNSTTKTLEELITTLSENDFSCESASFFSFDLKKNWLSRTIDGIDERYEEKEFTDQFRVKIRISEQETYTVLVTMLSKTFTLSFTPQNFWDRFTQFTHSFWGQFVSFCRNLFGVTNHAPDTSPTKVPDILNSYTRAMSQIAMLEPNMEKAKLQLNRTPYAGDGKTFRSILLPSPREERACPAQEDTFSASISPSFIS